MRLLASALAALIPALALPGEATGLRCNHDWIEVGEPAAQLLSTCGEPLLRETLDIEDASQTRRSVEQWTYSFGPGTLLRIVTIEDGRVRMVQDGDRERP